jgi:hypothetical protein
MTEAVETKPETTEAVEKAETIQVTDLNQFVTLLIRWHDTKCRLLKHMETIPEDAVVEIDGVDHTFTPEMRQGFKLGLTIALAELGTLPFAAEVDEEPSAANDPQGN